jgi:predicted short-subunit dehydrogenase-like oxidoreductase (DUF2520 family)
MLNSNSDIPALVIVGPGRVGTHLGNLLAASNWPVGGIVGRDIVKCHHASELISPTPSVVALHDLIQPASLLLLTVTDDSIQSVCERLVKQGAIGANSIVLHTSGACNSSLLTTAAAVGASTGSLHPLQTFMAASAGIETVAGTHWFFEGDSNAEDVARQLVQRLNGIMHCIESSRKVLYHASATIASNYVNTVMQASLDCAAGAGIEDTDMMSALEPLVTMTVKNMFRSDPVQSLTGPISRGDVNTIRDHLGAMASDPPLAKLYGELAVRTVDMALASGRISQQQADLIRIEIQSSLDK